MRLPAVTRHDLPREAYYRSGLPIQRSPATADRVIWNRAATESPKAFQATRDLLHLPAMLRMIRIFIRINRILPYASAGEGEDMQPKTERFEMRLDPGTIERVDAWRAKQADLPSRAEAIRRLIETELASTESKTIKFSDGEKLITHMLCEVYKHIKIDSEIDPKLVEAALHGGHNWGLQWEYKGIFHDHEDSMKTVSEVVSVLDMWSFIEGSYAKLSKEDKDRVEKEAGSLGKHVSFYGFDGNNESEHLGVAGFLIKDLERFSTFKGRSLNSHMPSIEGYRRMLRVFEPMRRTLMRGDLSADQIIELLNAWRHDGGSW